MDSTQPVSGILYLLNQQKQTGTTKLISDKNHQWCAQTMKCRRNLSRNPASADASCCRRGINEVFQQDRETKLEPLPRAHANGRPQTKIECARNMRPSPLLQNNSQEPTNRQRQLTCEERSQRRERTALSRTQPCWEQIQNQNTEERWRVPGSSFRHIKDRGNYLAPTPTEQPLTTRSKKI